MNLSDVFTEKMKKKLGNEFSAFENSLKNTPPISMRLNHKKQKSFKENFEKVKWNPDKGLYLPTRPIFTLDPIFQGGGYYVQEASSMFLSEVIRQISVKNQSLKILDLCAAPGGKSTLLLSEMPENSLLVANEVIKSRYQILRQNLIKWGFSNIISSNHDPKDFEKFANYFDVILVDAPCSGEGLFRKDENAKKEWSEANVELCASRQKRILAAAEKLVKPDGFLIYSTCTYNQFENDDNAKWISETFDFQIVELKIPDDWGIVKTNFGYQFYPHKTKGEGFYISILKKEINKILPQKKSKTTNFKTLKKLPKARLSILINWIEQPENFAYFINKKETVIALEKQFLNEFQLFDNLLYRKNLGIEIGTFKRTDFIPSHDLALSNIIKKDLPKIELKKEEALTFLRKENPQLESKNLGWHLITFEGLNLGWIKILKNRVNNYYPKNWRILMRK